MGSLAGRFSDVLLLHNCPAGVSDVKVGRQCEFKPITHDAIGENDARAQVDLSVSDRGAERSWARSQGATTKQSNGIPKPSVSEGEQFLRFGEQRFAAAGCCSLY